MLHWLCQITSVFRDFVDLFQFSVASAGSHSPCLISWLSLAVCWKFSFWNNLRPTVIVCLFVFSPEGIFIYFWKAPSATPSLVPLSRLKVSSCIR